MAEHPSWRGLEGNTSSDFASADYAYAKKNNLLNPDGTPSIKQAAEARAGKFTWHHNEDMNTMQLIPMALHENVPHSGGAALIRKAAYDAAH
jgi:hypothetical protein